MSEHTLGFWEDGRVPVPPEVALAARELTQQLETIDPEPADGCEKLNSDLRRRDFLIGVVGLPASMAAVDLAAWERLAYAFSHPSRIDRAAILHLEQTTVRVQGWSRS